MQGKDKVRRAEVWEEQCGDKIHDKINIRELINKMAHAHRGHRI